MKYEKWLHKHVRSLEGKRAIVTGANSGIGFEAARMYAYLGAEVVLACRNEGRAATARDRILAEFPSAKVEIALVDLASIASIDAFADTMILCGKTLDICLHCAGVYYPRTRYTQDGYPMTEGVNYIGTIHLADRLLPLMSADGRMIFTTSLVDRFGKPDVVATDEGYGAYSRSKTLLSAEIIRRAAARGDGAPAYIAVHPGITATDLLSPDKTTHKPFFSRLGHAFLYLFTHSPEKAALTAVLAAAGEISNGSVIGPRGIFGISGYPHEVRFAPRARKCADGRIVTVHAVRCDGEAT